MENEKINNEEGGENLQNHPIEKKGGENAVQYPSENLPEDEEQVRKSGEITNNDGSVIETLDTAFHNKPGMIKEHSLSGSNRAEYYEAMSKGMSDSEEEVEELKKMNDDKKLGDG